MPVKHFPNIEVKVKHDTHTRAQLKPLTPIDRPTKSILIESNIITLFYLKLFSDMRFTRIDSKNGGSINEYTNSEWELKMKKKKSYIQ